MISKSILQKHYQEYAARPAEWVADRAAAKEAIVKYVLEKIKFRPKEKQLRIVVIGASDRRYVSVHRKIFEKLISPEIHMDTFDIEVDHLEGEVGIILHDATLPFPAPPYSIIFSHSLMKFLTTEEQVKVIKNSFEALEKGGFAMHIMHSAELEGTDKLLDWQYKVNLPALVENLKQNKIPEIQIFDFESPTMLEWMRKTTVLVTQKNNIPI